MNGLDWLKNTHQDYRRGYIEGQAGERDCYMLEFGAKDREQYEQGFRDGVVSNLLRDVSIGSSGSSE